MSNQVDYFIHHEDRLQTLEASVSEMRADVAVLQSQVENGFEMLQESFGRLATKLDAINQIEPRVTALEAARARANSVGRWVARVAATVVAALVLIFLGIKP